MKNSFILSMLFVCTGIMYAADEVAQVVTEVAADVATVASEAGEVGTEVVAQTPGFFDNLKGICVNTRDAGKNFLNIGSDAAKKTTSGLEKTTGFIKNNPKVCIGALVYAGWYGIQKKRTYAALRLARAYLERIDSHDISVLNWRKDDYPTVVEINANQAIFRQNLANGVHNFTVPFCRQNLTLFHGRINYTQALNRALTVEINEIETILQALGNDRELTWIRTDMIQPQLGGRDFAALNNEHEYAVINDAVTSYVDRLGLPGGQWYAWPRNIFNWCAGMVDVNAAECYWIPTRIARAILFPYEGKVAQCYWQLYKAQQRLIAMRNTIGVNAILAAPQGVIVGHAHHNCGSRYCNVH